MVRQIVEVPINHALFLSPLPERNISFCIVQLDPVQEAVETDRQQEMLRKQGYEDWKAVYFVKGDEDAAKGHSDAKAVLVKDRGNKGHNIEQALTKHCPHRGFALLLNKGEIFNSSTALAELASLVRPRDVLGAFLPLTVKNTTLVPPSSVGHFYRKQDGIVNPKLSQLKNISNHMRLFSI
jgi:hypothetical protein